MAEEPARLPGECLDRASHQWLKLPALSMSGRKVEECSRCRVDKHLYEKWVTEIEADNG